MTVRSETCMYEMIFEDTMTYISRMSSYIFAVVMISQLVIIIIFVRQLEHGAITRLPFGELL